MTSQAYHDFTQDLRDYLQRQGPSYRRADFAKAIGISPRHLNRVLQGTRNLSTEAQARAEGAMRSAGDADSVLRKWLRERGMTVSEFAARLGKPQKTVEGWVYRAKMPSDKNREMVYSITGLPGFGRRHVPIRDKGPAESASKETSMARQRAQRAAANFYQLVRDIQALADGSRATRDHFRQKVAGPDVGYLRSALAALLDEKHLLDWKRMSSYRPGQSGGTS